MAEHHAVKRLALCSRHGACCHPCCHAMSPRHAQTWVDNCTKAKIIQDLVNILQAFPSWQLLLVDLRCHGESARLPMRPGGPHSLETSAGDILRLLGRLKLFPEVLIGHSFGGKVSRCSDLSSQSCLTIPQQRKVLSSVAGL